MNITMSVSQLSLIIVQEAWHCTGYVSGVRCVDSCVADGHCLLSMC